MQSIPDAVQHKSFVVTKYHSLCTVVMTANPAAALASSVSNLRRPTHHTTAVLLQNSPSLRVYRPIGLDLSSIITNALIPISPFQPSFRVSSATRTFALRILTEDQDWRFSPFPPAAICLFNPSFLHMDINISLGVYPFYMVDRRGSAGIGASLILPPPIVKKRYTRRQRLIV